MKARTACSLIIAFLLATPATSWGAPKRKLEKYSAFDENPAAAERPIEEDFAPFLEDLDESARPNPAKEDLPPPIKIKTKLSKGKKKAESGSETEKSLKSKIAQLEGQVDDLRARLSAESKADKLDYDGVPPEEAGAVAGRLRVLYHLILRHGRAYDYRLLTTEKLRDILHELDAAQEINEGL